MRGLIGSDGDTNAGAGRWELAIMHDERAGSADLSDQRLRRRRCSTDPQIIEFQAAGRHSRQRHSRIYESVTQETTIYRHPSARHIDVRIRDVRGRIDVTDLN